jgi:hypothetical protein
MIGTTVKLGFDGSAVKSGLASVNGMFSKFNKTFAKEVSIGAMRQIGARGTDAIMTAVRAIPDATKDLMDYAGGLNDISSATGVAVKDLMVLEEALRLGGAEGDINKVIFTLQKNMQEAVADSGDMRDAFKGIGIDAQSLQGMSVVDQIKAIMQAAKDSGKPIGEINDAMAKIFGGRFGPQIKKLLEDFSGTWAEAEGNVGSFADEMDKSAAKLDRIGDILGRVRMVIRELAFAFLKGFVGGDLDKGADAATTMIESLRGLAPLAEGIGKSFSGMLEPAMQMIKWIADQIKAISEQGFGNWFNEATGDMFVKMGEQIGAGFVKNLPGWLRASKGDDGGGMFGGLEGFFDKLGFKYGGKVIGEDPIGDFKRGRMGQDLKTFFDFLGIGGGGMKTSSVSKDLINETKTQTGVLERILREKGTPMFA